MMPMSRVVASKFFVVCYCCILSLKSPSAPSHCASAFSSERFLSTHPHLHSTARIQSSLGGYYNEGRKSGIQSPGFTSRGRSEGAKTFGRSPTHQSPEKANNFRGNTLRTPQHNYSYSTLSSSSTIDCPHFGKCPGCIVDADISDIDVVKSAKLYFSSLSVQKHALPSEHDRRQRYIEEQDDFFNVVVPSAVTSWRSQAKLAVAPTSTWSRSSGATIGLYMRNSHNVLAIPDCRVHHPSINRAVDMIVEATKKVRTPVYSEESGEGLLRYIQLQVELSSGKVCLTLVMNAEKLKECQPHLSFLVKELKRMDDKKEIWHSMWCHCNDSAGNAIFARDSSRWHPLEGPPYIREKIPGSDPNVKEGLLYFSPMVFRQGNFDGFGEIAREVREAIPQGSKVCELYAGVGLLGLSALLHHGRHAAEDDDPDGGGLQWLRCSDENPENARCFERAVSSMPMHITGRIPKNFQSRDNENIRSNKQRNGNKRQTRQDTSEMSMMELINAMTNNNYSSDSSSLNPAEKVSYYVASAASALHQGQALGADVLIVDPPRKGLEEPVLQQLCQPHNSKQPYVETATMLSHLSRHSINWVNDVRTLIYVSCGFDALARDCDRLLGSNAGWKLESATGYILFPGSNHVESVVIFRR